MRKLDEDILLLGLFILLGNVILVLLHVENPEVYVSFAVLLYFLISGFGSELRRVKGIHIIDIVLLTVFLTIILYRLLSVLTGGQ